MDLRLRRAGESAVSSHGTTGAGFWCYGCTSNSWDDYDGGDPDYGVVYYAHEAPPSVPRTEAIIPSRRWEAWREGTEDYQYLYQLQETLRKARERGLEEPVIRPAEEVLRNCLQEILEEAPSAERYDRARQALTEILLRLQQTRDG